MIPFRRAYYPSLQKGSLINFQYLFYKVDPSPLVLVTSLYSDGRIAGINLHYLTYRYVRNLLKNFCDDKTFNYQKIKGDKFLYNSFRTYKRNGAKNIHMMNCEAMNKLLGAVRSFNFNPNELAAMQDQIKQQIQGIQNPNAADMVGKVKSMITPFKHDMFKQDKRFNPNLGGDEVNTV